ncbi:SDR family NAD(P)-dependent oxidoreductase [Mariniblastus fucicola]|nr:SDR family oxidoreductase [Mariniblastus fucicola]
MSKTALVTGASSGIGLELAKLFAAAGHPLILTARSGDKLESLRKELVETHSVHVEVIVADLAEADAATKLADELASRKLVVDILVNNAGFGELGRFHEIDVERQVNMVRLNVLTLVHLTRLLVPEMIKRKSGGILNVGSTAAFQPGPNMAVYYATKAFVLSFSEALHEELLERDISVTCLCPGPTETGFGADSGMGDSAIFKSNAMGVEAVAQAGFEGLKNNRAIVIPGLKNRFGAFMTRLVPRFVTRKLVKRLQVPNES